MSVEEFTSELNRLMDEANLNQSALARKHHSVGSPQMIGAWLRGDITSPDPRKVFAVERALGARPGQLSRHLGYVPNDALEPQEAVGFDQWMDEHAGRLTARQRELLTGIYTEFVGPPAPSMAEMHAQLAADNKAAETAGVMKGLRRPRRPPDEDQGERPAS